jgi:histidyl-tRNA synthetase
MKELLRLYLIPLTDEARTLSAKICHDLRKINVICDTDLLGRSLKAQMREANKLNAEFVFIIGEEELNKGKGTLKKMSDGSQKEIPFTKLKENF